MNGNFVLDETYDGQSSSLFSDISIQSIPLSDIADTNAPITKTISLAAPFYPKTDDNLGKIINYSNLPNGLYWIYIVDGNDKICFMNTIRKGL